MIDRGERSDRRGTHRGVRFAVATIAPLLDHAGQFVVNIRIEAACEGLDASNSYARIAAVQIRQRQTDFDLVPDPGVALHLQPRAQHYDRVIVDGTQHLANRGKPRSGVAALKIELRQRNPQRLTQLVVDADLGQILRAGGGADHSRDRIGQLQAVSLAVYEINVTVGVAAIKTAIQQSLQDGTHAWIMELCQTLDQRSLVAIAR